MPRCNFFIYFTMGWSYAQSPGAERLINRLISNDFDFYFVSRKFNLVFLINKFFIPSIIWMYANCGISDFCLGASRSYRNWKVLGVSKCIKDCLARLVFYLIVGNHRLSFGIPVYNLTLAHINQTLVMHLYECFLDCITAFCIQRIGKP